MTSTETNNKHSLQNTLANLLGFDDGAEDVLEHLLSIESKNDLTEYLSQLLGDNPNIVPFAENVGRFQRGEPILLNTNETVQDDSKPPAKEEVSSSSSSSSQSLPLCDKQTTTAAAKSITKSQQTSNDKVQSRKNSNNNNSKKSRVPAPRKKSPTPPPSLTAAKAGRLLSTNENSAAATTTTQQQPPPKSIKKVIPTRGKAKIVCGCFGTLHEALTNCLYCGRISCSKEGYGFCPFCGYDIEPVRIDIHRNDKAWQQKERLLSFDRDFASRTKIYDDQSDYIADDTWLSSQEKELAEEKQTEKLQNLRRQNQKMQLSM